jgi:hypothetical protein
MLSSLTIRPEFFPVRDAQPSTGDQRTTSSVECSFKASCAGPHQSGALARHRGPDTPHPRSRPSASRTSGPRRRSRALHPRSRIARASLITPRVLDGVEVHPSAPQLASNHAFICRSRLPSPSGRMPILMRTGNRCSASRAACCTAFIEQPARSRSGLLWVQLLAPANRVR